MKKSIRYIVLFLAVVTAGLWTCLQFDAVQTWGKERASRYVLQETGYKVTAGSFRGAPPFLLGVDNIELTHPDIGSIHIDSLDIIPSWFEMMFGRISFLWVCANGIDLTHLTVKGSSPSQLTSLKELLPPVSFALHSLHLTDIQVPKAYYEPLLNTYSEQSVVDFMYSVSGSMSWNPRKEKLSASLSALPYAGEISPLTVDATLAANATTSSFSLTIDALKVSDGSVFFSLPCDRLSFDASAEAKTEEVLQALFGKSSATFAGTWNIGGIHREKAHAGLNPVLRFSASGNFEASNHENFSFATTELSCQKIEPIQSYTQSKKDKVNQEIMLANAEDPKDASTLSRITNIPTPGSIQGSLKRENAKLIGTLIASSITLGDQSIPTASISLNSQKTIDQGSTGSFKADISLLHGNSEIPISLSTNVTSSDAFNWQLPDVAINVGGHSIAGELQVNLFPLVVRGKLESARDDARELAKLLDASIGSLHCKAVFTGDALTQKMDSSVVVDSIDSAWASCRKAALAISSEGPLSNPTITATFDASNIVKDSLQLHTMHAETVVDPKEALSGHPYSLQIAGKSLYGPCSLNCKGAFTNTSFTLNTFQALSGGHTIKNSMPLHITNDKDGLSLYPFEFISETNMLLQGDALITDNLLKASLTWANLPLECFDPFLGDITLFGNISGHLDLSGKKRDPQLAITVASSALSLWNPNKLQAPPLNASCEVTLQHGLLHVTSEVEGLSLKKPTIFELTAPLEFGPSSVSLSDASKLSGHLLAEFDSNTILSSYLDEDEIMEGLVQIDARLSGIASNPIVTGTVSWNEGKLFIPCLGTLFNSVQMAGHLQDNKLLVEQLTANDGANGKFEASGWIKNLLSKKMHYQLDGKTQNFAAIALDDSRATATGTLVVTGDLAHTNFTAALDIDDAAFILSPTLSKDIPKLDITYVGAKNEPVTQQKNPFLFGLDLELKLKKGHVRGMGLESLWTGNAHVTGQNKAIDVDGKILLGSGTLDFAGKTFKLTQGSLEFRGDLYKKSKLHVLAANDVGAISTSIMLQGALEAPRIVIQSNPAMSQKEILSWILFNKSSSDISPMQGIQLGQTLLKLKGTHGIDVIEEIKQKLHIDRLDFGAGQSAGPQINSTGSGEAGPGMQESIPNEVSVQVGKYISDGVIVTLSKDVTNEVNRVGVEANLTQHITAQANVGDDAQTELSLEWKLRY